MIKSPKKLIEVALPLDDINNAAAYEKLPGIGPHPRSIHHWWARRPFGAARAILFAQFVNDPGGDRGWGNYKGQTKEDAQRERERLLDILRKLADWKNSENTDLLEEAKKEIYKSWEETCRLNSSEKENFQKELPSFHDPFSGGGAIPFEAQRLGIKTYASDLNPIPVIINKALLEIPSKFVDRKPYSFDLIPLDVNQKKKHKNGDILKQKKKWVGTVGLSEDVNYYGNLILQELKKRVGHLYPKIMITKEMAEGRKDLAALVGQELIVISWLWARTVKSPNPAYASVDVPLLSSFVLSRKKNNKAWLDPEIKKDRYILHVRTGEYPKSSTFGTKLSWGAKFKCILSETPIEPKYIKNEGVAGRIKYKMVAIVAKGNKGRIYLPATSQAERIALSAKPQWGPKMKLNYDPRAICTPPYGLDSYDKLFTARQLSTLATIVSLLHDVRKKIISDGKTLGIPDDGKGIDDGGEGATAYGDAITLYLSFCLSRCVDFNNTLVRWNPGNEKIMNSFGRQAIQMVWDFGEANLLESVVGGFPAILKYQCKCIKKLHGLSLGKSIQANAISQTISNNKVISTDPPYYDNVPYSDISDFFYVWQRQVLKNIFPMLFATMNTPKNEELVANPYRHGSKEKGELFFLDGMTKAVKNIADQSHQAFPITLYYAFKQDANTASIAWETFLDAIIEAGLMITGTWPMRSEQSTRMRSMGSNALASSIVLVCRKRPKSNYQISRRQFQRELKNAMPEALDTMIGGHEGVSPVAPVDLAQASIGPGMAVYSRYDAVLEADGSPMSVHDALVQINREIDDYFNAAEGDLDPDSRFCIDWFQQYGFKEGTFGEADVVARAKGTSVDAVAASGVIKSGGGKVQLLTFSDFPKEWNPDKDPNIPIWEATHQLIRALRGGGEKESGFLLSRLPGKTEKIRQLAYRLYTLCERQGWAEEARAYNELISSWHGIVSDSKGVGIKRAQLSLFRT